MARFKKVDFTVEFSLSMTDDNDFNEVMEMVRKAQWGFLLELAAKRNMSASGPSVSGKSRSNDPDGDVG